MSEPKLVTENNYINRKVRFQAYAGIIITIITAAAALGNSVFGWGIEVPKEHIEEIVTSGLIVVSAILTAVGYITKPGPGDGVKPAADK